MNMIFAILLPLVFGAVLPFLKIQNRKLKLGLLTAVLGVEAALWQALVYWCEFCAAYAHCLEAWARGLEDEREIRLAGLRQVVRIGEPAHQEMLDVYWFLKTLDRTVLPVL